MKKSIIAAGAASVALAAMPIVGVFAAEQTVSDGSTIDELNVEITSGCSVADTLKNKTIPLTVAPGTTRESTAAGSITIVCTGVDWTVTAEGAGTEGHENALTQTVEEGTPEYIVSNASAAEGASNWLYKVASSTNISGADVSSSIPTAVKSFHAVPAKGSAETIASGSDATTSTINTQYQVTAALDQKAGTYTGKVTYTVAHTEDDGE